MVWMKTFCFCCSVRLGVIVSGIFSIIHGSFACAMLAIYGPPVMNSAKYFIKREEQYDENMFLWKMMDSLSKYRTHYLIFFHTLAGIHIITSSLVIYGAVKLQKWFLVPYIITQCSFMIGGMIQHIITMFILKNIVSLECLIVITLAGFFFILFIAYTVGSAAALFQIIILVNSQTYKALYGQNPLAPEKNIESHRRKCRDVKIFFIPNKKEFNPIKEMISKHRKGKMVLPVKPIDTLDEKEVV